MQNSMALFTFYTGNILLVNKGKRSMSVVSAALRE